MTDQPLSSGEQSKVIIFGLLMLPVTVMLVGAIPAISLIVGIFMMRKNSDFSHIDTAIKIAKLYAYILLIILAVAAILFLFLGDGFSTGYEAFYMSLLFGFVLVVYIILMTTLFYNPLKAHKNWVAANGIFSNKSSLAKKSASGVDIIKREKMGSYSVADEMLKWAKMKQDGLITEQEYHQAKMEILKNS